MGWFPSIPSRTCQSKEALIKELQEDVKLAQQSAREAHDALKITQRSLDNEMKQRMDAEYRANVAHSERRLLERRVMDMQQENETLAKELENMAELSRKLKAAYKLINELKKKLNIRSGKESPYGLSTPSSKLPNKSSAPPEQQARKGGGQPGHEGHGSRAFTHEEADRIIKEVQEPDPIECCDKEDLVLRKTFLHSNYTVIPMRIEKVVQTCGVWQCKACGKTVVGPLKDTLPGMLYDNQSIAEMVVRAFVDFAPFGQVARQMNMNKSTLLGIFHNLTGRFEKLFTHIFQRLKYEEWLHADETLWRANGVNGYSWIFINAKNRVFLFRRTRSSSVPQEVFGPEPVVAVLVSDRYGGYSPLAIEHQYCYVHLLRDLKKILAADPDNIEVAQFVGNLSAALKKVIALQGEDGLSDAEYYGQAREIKQEIIDICKDDAKDGAVRAMQDLFREKTDRLFQWVLVREIPCHNNTAERGLRPLVIARKISFGCQGEKGLKTREVLTTVVQTLLARGFDVRDFITKALNVLVKSPKADLIPLLTKSAQ